MRRTVVIALVLQTAAAATSLAQQAANSPYPGSMLRITLAGQESVTGTLFRSDAQGVVVRHDGDTVRVAWEAVERLEIARATRGSNALKIGAGVGAVVGLLAGVGVNSFCSHFAVWAYDRPHSCPEAIPIGLVGGLALGAGIGGIISVNSRARRWEEVPLDRLRVSVVPQRGGRFGFGVSVAF